jgi:hypothetical protein
MKTRLLWGLLVVLALLLGGCVPVARNPVSLFLILLEVAIQLIGLIGVIYAAYQRFRSQTKPAGASSPVSTKPARLPGNSS